MCAILNNLNASDILLSCQQVTAKYKFHILSNKPKYNSRRQFLRNTLLTSVAAGVYPVIASGAAKKGPVIDQGCNTSTLDYYGQGPFYLSGAPVITGNQLAGPTEPGTRLIISGMVQNLNCTSPIANATIDVWHANNLGQYDTAGPNLRGITYSNAQGFYEFETIHPGKYLNGSVYRPSHIHFRITPPGFPTLITQLYFQGDTHIPGDPAASITSGTYDATHRIIPLTINGQGKYEGTWDIVVNGPTGIEDIRADKGMIYSVSPNPFTDSVTIRYGLYKTARVSLKVYNMAGGLVALLDERELTPGKYTAEWIPEDYIAAGTYFITLHVNDLQVHYQKVIRK
jgi:protocatechuate 3,4-dioxygenase beta subunit